MDLENACSETKTHNHSRIYRARSKLNSQLNMKTKPVKHKAVKPSYRMLKAGEKIREHDQRRDWIPVHVWGFTIGKNFTPEYRRKLPALTRNRKPKEI